MKKNIKNRVLELKLPDDWQGFAVEKWADFAFDPEKLTENPDRVFKLDGQNVTGLKTIDDNGKEVSFVFKKTISGFCAKSAFDFLRDPKSVKNLSLAVELKNRQIDSAEPVAALWRKRRFKSIENIYLTEYIPDCMSLYDVAFGKNSQIVSDFSVKKSVITAVAELIASLHKAGYWHRDSKAGNFIVYKNSAGVDKTK
ncbi:MAG: lipopolysaccharide kinase InaA family protein, partial [Phycisphaerae bacterium]|nr:lipopolysaccharide kinase InaA family protein [Phycisphaerae bacterium]